LEKSIAISIAILFPPNSAIAITTLIASIANNPAIRVDKLLIQNFLLLLLTEQCYNFS